MGSGGGEGRCASQPADGQVSLSLRATVLGADWRVNTIQWLLKVGHNFVEGNNIRLNHMKLPFLKAKLSQILAISNDST